MDYLLIAEHELGVLAETIAALGRLGLVWIGSDGRLRAGGATGRIRHHRHKDLPDASSIDGCNVAA